MDILCAKCVFPRSAVGKLGHAVITPLSSTYRQQLINTETLMFPDSKLAFKHIIAVLLLLLFIYSINNSAAELFRSRLGSSIQNILCVLFL